MARNAQKRLFIGVGCELLVKAFFLKQGYGINRIDFREMKRRSLELPASPYRIDTVDPDLLSETDTFTFNQILDQLSKIPVFAAVSGLEIWPKRGLFHQDGFIGQAVAREVGSGFVHADADPCYQHSHERENT